jgi:hypothetical protein
MDRDLLVKNAVSTVRTIKTFQVPVVHSTINVASGRGQPTLPELADLLTDDKPLDRMRSTPSSTRSAAPRPRPTAPAWTA